MKRIAVVALAALIILALSASSFAFQNEPDGFRGLKWGDSPTEDMIFKFKDSQLSRAYTRPTDKLSKGDAKFTYIDYSFYTPPEGNEQLYGVYLALDKMQPSIATLLSTCWKNDPDKRPSAEEVVNELEQIQAEIQESNL